MRNLKKILALVLALVMSLSLMATAGAGSFQDVTDDNPYKTAIDVLDELKVFQGFEDGTFKPDSKLNRAQAAVLVYRIATGDVEGKQVDNYTYMAQSKFTDLDGYNWAKGYINYCQNAGIVVGTDATHFNPGGKVTGYQLLVMLLRTLGYGKAGEFADPKGWELQTASIAKREGILENITSGDFGAAAPRQMVAEILFRGLLKETVQYSALTPGGYTKTGETLGKKNLGLEEITGVVVANEYADLRDDDPLAADKTAMVVGDETYTLDKGTTLDDIGEARHAYIQNGSTVLYLADAGNTTEESTDAEKVDDVLSRAGITKGSADEYINFGKGFNWKSPWKIKYVLTLDETEWVTTTITADDMVYLERVVENARDDGYSLTDISAKNGKLIGNYSLVKNANGKTYDLLYTREFAIREDIPAGDRSNIEKIFNVADKIGDNYITGEVYAGTTSKEDLSDKITLDDFIADYITADAMDPVSKNEKGNWLKVIDNNGDGKAEYILKVVYTGAQVERVKDDKITLDVKDHSLVTGTAGSGHDRLGVKDDINTLTSQKVAPMDDAALEEGDVVYYAIIDGVARAYKAEMVTATIDKINRNTKSTTTEDGTEYFESGVCNHILNTEYKDQVTDLVGKVKFDLYFDRGGWLLTFIKSNRASDFKLITDGWYNSTKSGKEYAVKVYDEEEDKQVTVDLISGGDMFVGRDVEYWDRVAGKIRTTDNNDWLALKYLGGTVESNGAETNFIGTHNTETAAALNGNTVSCTGAGPYTHTNNNVIRTTVASIDEEGNILPVEDYRITGRYDHAMIDVKDNKVPTSAYTQGTIYTTDDDTAYNKAGTTNGAELRALSTTKYYVVWPASDGVSVGGVKAFTGYSSVSSIKALASKDADYDLVEDVYAVGTETTRDNQHGNAIYYTADIVVVELNDTPVNARTMVLLVDDEGQVDKTGLRHVQIIDEDGSSKWIDTKDYESSQLKAREYEKKLQPGLYYMTKVSSDPELYKLEVMTGADIRDAECFISGQVQYNRGTVRNDYVVVNPYTWNGDEEGPIFDVGFKGDTVEPIIDTEKSKFYELGYGYDVYTYDEDGNITGINYADYREEAASLSKEDELTYRDVVEGRVEGVDGGKALEPKAQRDYYDTDDGQSYFYNDVLIRTDSDNKIVWAVSFQNTYNNAGDPDFAQFVWLNTMPDSAVVDKITFAVDDENGVVPDGYVVPADIEIKSDKNYYSFEIAKTVLESYDVTVDAPKADNNYDGLSKDESDPAKVVWTFTGVKSSINVTLTFTPKPVTATGKADDANNGDQITQMIIENVPQDTLAVIEDVTEDTEYAAPMRIIIGVKTGYAPTVDFPAGVEVTEALAVTTDPELTAKVTAGSTASVWVAYFTMPNEDVEITVGATNKASVTVVGATVSASEVTLGSNLSALTVVLPVLTDEEYVIKSVTVNGDAIAAKNYALNGDGKTVEFTGSTLKVDGPVVITVEKVSKTVLLTVSVTGEAATYTVDSGATLQEGQENKYDVVQSADPGTEVTMTVTPADGVDALDITVTEAEGSPETDGVTENKDGTYTVKFTVTTKAVTVAIAEKRAAPADVKTTLTVPGNGITVDSGKSSVEVTLTGGNDATAEIAIEDSKWTQNSDGSTWDLAEFTFTLTGGCTATGNGITQKSTSDGTTTYGVSFTAAGTKETTLTITISAPVG